MRIFPKKYFRWKEPKAFLRLNDALEKSLTRWWVQPLCALGGSALPFVSWYLARFDPSKNPPSFEVVLPLGLCFGVFMAYGIPWINRLCPSDVRFFKKHFLRQRGNINRHLDYKKYESFRWRVNDEFATLILKPHGPGKDLFIGVPLEISREAVSAFLIERDLRREEGVPQPEE
jgi:hypothetical protein